MHGYGQSTRVSAAGIACDHCGLPVPDDEPFVVLAAKGSAELYRRCFHERCWPSVALDGIERLFATLDLGVPTPTECLRICSATGAIRRSPRRAPSSSARSAVRGTTGCSTRSAGCTSAGRWS